MGELLQRVGVTEARFAAWVGQLFCQEKPVDSLWLAWLVMSFEGESRGVVLQTRT